MTKRNKWLKKQLRKTSRNYRVAKTIYVAKRIREMQRAYVIGVAKALWEQDQKPEERWDSFRNYATGVQSQESMDELRKLKNP